MEEQLKIDFEKLIENSNFSKKNVEIKEKILIILLKKVFRIKERKIGSFQILIK